MTRPRGVIPLDHLVDVPCGVRWVCYHQWSDCTIHSIRAYRDQLDRLLEGEAMKEIGFIVVLCEPRTARDILCGCGWVLQQWSPRDICDELKCTNMYL